MIRRSLVVLALFALGGCDYDSLIDACAANGNCVDETLLAPTLRFPRNGATAGRLSGGSVQVPIAYTLDATSPAADFVQAQVGYCKTVSAACFDGATATQVENDRITLTPPAAFAGLKAVWRVRACGGEHGACGSWSSPRYLRLSPGAVIAGDLDGTASPQRSELVIGHAEARSGAGEVVVYGANGSGNYASTLALPSTGTTAFGSLVAQVGDVNGDGRDDLVVGAGDLTARRLFLYPGTATTSLDEATRVELTWKGLGFGESVTPAGDVNADGYGDFLVTQNVVGGGTFLFLGGATVLPDPASKLTFRSSADGPAAAAAGIGDFNADGFDDVVLSEGATGRVLLYYGRALPGATLAYDDAIQPLTPNAAFGAILAAVGDLNADGHGDFYVADDTGESYLFFGAETLTAGVQPVYATTTDSVSAQDVVAGDVDGDGYSDYVLRLPTQVIIYFGSEDVGDDYAYDTYRYVDQPADTTTNFIDEYPRSLASAGDLDGDGADELVIGLDRQTGAAALHVVSFDSARNCPQDACGVITANETGNAFGTRLATVRP